MQNPEADKNSSSSNQLYRYTDRVNTRYSVRNSTILFQAQGRNEYKSSEVEFTAVLNSQHTGLGTDDNEISVRWSIDRHVGNNIVKCFDLGFGITTGRTRIRYEHEHPEYTDALATGETKGIPLSADLPVQLKFVKLDYWDRTTLFEVWQNPGDIQGWRELFSYRDVDHYVDEYPQGCQIAIKVRDYTDNVIVANINVYEIEGLLPPTEPA